jgi:MoxR-like ATPase
MQTIEQKERSIKIKPIVWRKKRYNKNFYVPWYGKLDIDIQTISNEALEKILTERKFYLDDIPERKEIIPIEDQSEYYREVKQQVIDRILTKKFAIIQWPTGTWKTTLVKTLWYEMQLPVYEVWADAEKTIDDFAKEIKTYKKWNILQIKELPWLLMKAITQWWIFLINEANTLQPDIQIALANMLESWFVIIWTKKYIVHPNFVLIFTSNEDYAWTNPYNKAVIRKAGWIVNFDYEPTLEWELKIVKTIYKKLKNEFDFEGNITEKDLKKITQLVRWFRQLLREYNANVSLEEKFLSQDLNEAWHFLYIRFYEKILKIILSSDSQLVDVKSLVLNEFASYLQDKIVWFSQSWEYIDHFNDFEKLRNLYYENIRWDVIVKLSKEKKEINKIKLDSNLVESLLEEVKKEQNLLNELWKFVDLSAVKEEKQNEEKRLKLGFTRKWINPNLFKKVVGNEIKSYWEKLKRIEAIEQIAQDMYEKLVETHREKVIWKIQYEKASVYWPVLWVEINWEKIWFKPKDGKQIDLSVIKTKEDVIKHLFGNDDVEIIYKDEVYDNIFFNPKSLEVRRYSKMIDYWDKIVFMWFRWEIRDIRYIWEESWKYYIPQSKVNDLLLSIYEILNEDQVNKLKKWHYLVINQMGELEFLTVNKIEERINNWEQLRVLKKTEDKLLEEDIRRRFANLDRLNLHNWAEEKQETGVPTPVYWKAYPIQRRIENQLFKNFEYIPPTTNKIIEQIIKYIDMWEDVLLIWPSGVGKSSIVKEVAKRKGLPYIDLQITDDLQETDLETQLRWNEGEIENMFSPFLDYWVNWWIVELKELNMASVLTFLNNFLDKNWSIVINGYEYKRHPDFHIIATINPFDNRLYTWTKPLNLAVQARFKVVNIDYLEKEEEKQVLLEVAKMYWKEKLLKEWLENLIEEILNFVVYPIRRKIEELRISQSMWTDEWLKILAEKNITIDILIRWIKTADTIEDIRKYVKEHLYLEEEKKALLPEDIKTIFDLF